MTELELKAIIFAFKKHDEIKQVRKYDSEPYINHPMRVANRVREVSHTPEMLAAAWLHDTVEDTNTIIDDIYLEFGDLVGDLVESLTDVAVAGDGNREVRVDLNLKHSEKGSVQSHTIKIADLIDNSISIIKHDPSFAKVYMKEKKALLLVLGDGDKSLLEEAEEIIKDWEENNF